MTWLLFALKNVMRNRRRTFITIVISAVGTAAILIAGGFGLYTYDSLREMSARDSGHIIIGHKKYFDYEESTPMEFGIDNYREISKKILSDENIANVVPRLQLSGIISNGEKSTVFVAFGVDPEKEFNMRGPFFKLIEGSVLSRKNDPEQDPPVMLGKRLAKQLKVKIGDTLTLLSNTTDSALNAIDVQIQGIFTIGVPELDKRMLMLPLTSAQSLIRTEKISSLSVYLFDTEDTDTVTPTLAQDFSDLAVQPWWKQANYYFAVRDLYNRIFGLLGVVIIAMVFFAVSNTLSMTIVERTREIGALRAMGTKPTEIIRNFVLEGSIIGVMGVTLGMVISVVASITVHFLDLQMPPPPARSEGYPLTIYIEPVLYTYASLLVIGLCIAAAWWTSRKAAQRPIVEALAHV